MSYHRIVSVLFAVFVLFSAPSYGSEPVDINRAGVAELAEALNGIGEVKAKAIVAYRQQHGDFETLEQLAEVKGIGPALVARNRERMQILPAPSQ